ncbi:hypothetical protein ACJ41O_006605 [Fusarium nematophilum]
MKFSLFSVTALAASACAFPILDTVGKVVGDVSRKAPKVPAVKDILPTVNGVVSKATRGLEVVDTVKGTVQGLTSVDVKDTASVIKVLTVAVEDVKSQTGAIKVIVSQVETKKVTQNLAATQIVKHFSLVNDVLTTTVNQLTGVVGLHITGSDVKAVLNLVIVLVKEVVGTVEHVVSTLGLQPAITAILDALLNTVASLLTLVTGLVGGIIPGLIDIISPILESFDHSALGSLLTPVAGVLRGLSA